LTNQLLQGKSGGALSGKKKGCGIDGEYNNDGKLDNARRQLEQRKVGSRGGNGSPHTLAIQRPRQRTDLIRTYQRGRPGHNARTGNGGTEQTDAVPRKTEKW